MAFDLGTLIRAAALGGGAYQQAQRDQEDRTRVRCLPTLSLGVFLTLLAGAVFLVALRLLIRATA